MTSNTHDDPLAFVRYRRGIVGESRREVHLVPVPPGAVNALTELPHQLVALCGQPFKPGEAEALPSLGGMPCVMCQLLAPEPDRGALGAVPYCPPPGSTSSGP